MSNYSTGHLAEKTAADYLLTHGFEVIELNWKTKACEIDIVAKRGIRIYFVEVKSRRSVQQGSGFDYVTSKKLQQMQFAAQMWVAANNWRGDYQLAVISIDGSSITFIEDING